MSAVSTEIVPFATMQRMATAVAKSRMFGVENEDQALALMALAQAEGIHPMTAVRDYHIIKGKPSLKAETMLARFLAAGGTVEWHELTKDKAEASFAYKSKPLRLSWTMEDAKNAGLASKDVWKAFPRAMLRSRLISEGVRTVCPGIVQGVYTPEEAEHIAAEDMAPINVSAAVDSFERPGLPQEQTEALLRLIGEATSDKDLKTAYQEAHRVALEARDELRIGSFALAYDARKGELAAPAATP